MKIFFGQYWVVLFLLILVAALGSPLLATPPSSNAFSFLTQALVRNDNDFDYFNHTAGKQVPLPPNVRQAIQKLAQENYQQALKDADPRFLPTPRQIIHTVFKVGGPESLELYVPFFERNGIYGPDYYFFLYDSKNETLTKEPEVISSRKVAEDDIQWNYPLQKPYVSFVDLYGDGLRGLIVEEFFHNGTDSNASIYHYDYIEKNLSFHEVLAVKSGFSFHYFSEKEPTEESIPHFCTVFRKVEPVGNNQLQVTTTVSVEKKAPVLAGTTLLKCDKPGEPFKIARVKVKDQRFEGFVRHVLWSREDEY